MNRLLYFQINYEATVKTEPYFGGKNSHTDKCDNKKKKLRKIPTQSELFLTNAQDN